MIEKLVIFGGSFDPIHKGHINMALETQNALGGPGKCRIVFLPNKNSVWKDRTTNPKDKLMMLKLAIKDYVNLDIDDFELNQNGPNYSYFSIKYFLNHYKDQNIEIYFLLGTDQLNAFHLWMNAEEISSLVKLLHYPRPDIIPNIENIKKYNFITLTNVKSYEASSNSIRNLEALDIPDSVLEYINKKDLYFLKHIKEYIDDKRFKHCKSVGLLAKKIADSNHLENSHKYYIAGLLHDIGKYVPKDIELAIERKYKEYMPIDKKLYHQFYSANIANQDFGIQDEEILDAIRYHATGKANMSKIGMIIYASDKVDPLRGYDSSYMIEALLKNYFDGFKLVLKENKKFLTESNKDINNRLTNECFKCYL